jgi:hypothetical protein
MRADGRYSDEFFKIGAYAAERTLHPGPDSVRAYFSRQALAPGESPQGTPPAVTGSQALVENIASPGPPRDRTGAGHSIPGARVTLADYVVVSP